MLWSTAVTSREILREAPLAVSPALPPSTSCFCGHPEGFGGSWGTPQLFVSKLLQVTQDSEGNILWSIPRPQNDYGCILWLCQADAISSSWLCRFSSPHSQSNSLTCAVLLLCTAAGSFDAYLKPGHGGQMEYYFFSPNTWWNPALDFICCSELLKKTWHTHTKRNK